MYTRCQACHTVHPVNAALLARGGGKYRCGKCHKVNNALEALFDEWPQASQQGTPPGELPELGLALSLGPDAGTTDRPDGTDTSAETNGGGTAGPPATKSLPRMLWISAAVILMIVITLNLNGFFRQTTPGFVWLQPALVWLGLRQEPPFRALDQIQLLNRELKADPSRPGVLVLSATVVNRAGRNQAYPDIDVTLLDIHNQRLTHRLFKPRDYLPAGSELSAGMRPEAQLSFTLEMPDPGKDAVGFEVQFR